MLRYSIIIPVYNRPEEVDELLTSLARQVVDVSDSEVLIVEDGSACRCDGVVEKYADRLDVHYFFKPNSGPGPTRNYGAERARGEWLIFLDSDCVLPSDYLENVRKALKETPVDAFGGPDRAGADFTPLQKAIDYSMTSPLTTGGIRGGRRSIDRFYPRSFNMGIRRDIFELLGGFSPLRFGEDIDLSYRIVAGGYTTRLFPAAWVYHKRRTRLRQFFKQVFNSGAARITLSIKHPGTLRLVHLLPAAFTAGGAVVLITACWWSWALSAFVIFAAAIFADAAWRTCSLRVGALAVVASFIQLTGYGSGFLYAAWQHFLRRRTVATAFDKTFYD